MRSLPLALLLAVALPTASTAAKPDRTQWVRMSDGVLKQLEQQGQKPAWPGKTTGVAADRTTGDVFMIVCGLGAWRSGDRGATFARVDGGAVGGRCETGYALRVDPKGRRLACFMLHGKSWRSIAPYPPSLKGEFNTHGWMMNFSWDAIGKVCYVARMSQPTCKCEY